jgi:dihydrofolate synthase/folylpolyglutamate synthase
MNYSQALDYLMNQLPMFQRIGAAAYKADLNNITQLCNLLGNPQRALKCIHIAGTNGKGSVTHIMASVLINAGFKVGIYTSPHYLTFRERIKVGSQFIEEDFITAFVSNNIEAFKKIDASFFEITTAMMFEYFKHKRVDYCVIETGMGGRLDSTNIIEPILSVITNISYDHQQFLGDTLQKIATEKAGIIKPNIPVLIGEDQSETHSVFLNKANETQSPIFFSKELVRVHSLKQHVVNFTIVEEGEQYSLATDLSGSYQQKNLQTALAALLLLQKQEPAIALESIQKGLANVSSSTYFIGRWMVVAHQPLIIFDSAHNEAGIKNVVAQLQEQSFQQLHFVFGTVADKDLTKVFEQLPRNAIYYFCKPSVIRGKNELELKHEVAAFELKGEAFQHPTIALAQAKLNAQPNDLIMVAGSIFLVADVMANGV